MSLKHHEMNVDFVVKYFCYVCKQNSVLFMHWEDHEFMHVLDALNNLHVK